MALQVLVGLKRLDAAKTRLHPDVPPAMRRRLMLEMLAVVVAAARGAALGPVALATSEPTAPALGRRLGVGVVPDGGLPWNQGLVRALETLRPAPAAVLYLAGDLPLVTAGELIDFAAAAPRPGVAVARARDGGTNALLVTPASAMAPTFGVPRSSEAHRRAAAALGLPCLVLDVPGLALDVDTLRDAQDAGLMRTAVSERGRARARG